MITPHLNSTQTYSRRSRNMTSFHTKYHQIAVPKQKNSRTNQSILAEEFRRSRRNLGSLFDTNDEGHHLSSVPSQLLETSRTSISASPSPLHQSRYIPCIPASISSTLLVPTLNMKRAMSVSE